MSQHKDILVVKRNKKTEPVDLEKIHKVLFNACEGISGVSVSDIEMRSGILLYNRITTKDIHKILIKATSDLISEDAPNYQYVAANLLNYDIRKEVWGGHEPTDLIDVIDSNIKKKTYDKSVKRYYSDDEWSLLNNYIKHDRDYIFTYAGLQQVVDKYLVQNRTTDRLYETPQFMYMMISAVIFHNYPSETRLQYVKDYYDAISQHKLNLPTPLMAGVRTPVKQYSSCVLIDVDDDLDSLIASQGAMTKYVSKRAGIGLNFGRIRSIGSQVRGGEVKHTGVIPFLQSFQSGIKSCCLTPNTYVEIIDED